MNQSIEQIKSINHHFRHAIEQVGEGIVIIEPSSRHPLGPQIVFANRAVAELTGYDRDSLVEQPIGLIYEPESLNHLLVRLPRVAEAGKVFEMKKEIVNRDGDRFPCHWTVSAVRDSKGTPVNYTFTLKPVKENALAPEAASGNGSHPQVSVKETDQEIEDGLEQSRVESLALLAGGIAHDFNNVLQTILSNLSLAKLETSVHSPARRFVEDAMEATEDAQSLAQQILDFTKGREPMIQVINLGDIVKGVAKLSTMGSQVRCDITTPEGLWGVEVEKRQIRQVIHNLMVNACQAMPNGGVVQAFVENFMVPANSSLKLPAGPYVVVRIRDRGCGIPDERQSQIFEPYFTTKKNGTGIGLATCRAIVQRHHGTITLVSKQNVGTEFRVFLPACQIFEDAEEEITTSVSGRESLVGGNGHRALTGSTAVSEYDNGMGRVLVVDDQDNVREAAERLLERLGYDTVSAASGQEAVGLYRECSRSGDPINAVLLDMTLPGGLSGDEVMSEIRKMDHRARVIATSGYFDDDAEETFRREGYVGILPKPYAVERLSEKLIEAMSN
ncbi:MAG: response regulator [Verrucomicrobiae bacterium]|nr:response regulator [Verrucomicrobiae bacterium]